MKTPSKFPYEFRHTSSGRNGTIYKLGNGTFKSRYRFGGNVVANTFATVEKAVDWLQKELSTIDHSKENTPSLNPLRYSLQYYAELEQLLESKVKGASLRETVEFFISKFERYIFKTVETVYNEMIKASIEQGITYSNLLGYKQHIGAFSRVFGSRLVNDINREEVFEFLSKGKCKNGNSWSGKTRNNYLISLQAFGTYAKDHEALRGDEKTVFHKISKFPEDNKEAVGIFTNEEISKLLAEAIKSDVNLIPLIVIQAFCGLRPSEIHAERVGKADENGKLDKATKRPPLKWENFNWEQKTLSVIGQKVRSKYTRNIHFSDSVIEWLKPFQHLTGNIWNEEGNYSTRLAALRDKAEVQSVHDGLRHSYASTRVLILKNELGNLALEMGNSPQELLKSYINRTVTLQQAEQYFKILPPPNYAEMIKAVL